MFALSISVLSNKIKQIQSALLTSVIFTAAKWDKMVKQTNIVNKLPVLMQVNANVSAILYCPEIYTSRCL